MKHKIHLDLQLHSSTHNITTLCGQFIPYISNKYQSAPISTKFKSKFKYGPRYCKLCIKKYEELKAIFEIQNAGL